MWPIPKWTIIIAILYNKKHLWYTKTFYILSHLLSHVYKRPMYVSIIAMNKIFTQKKVIGILICQSFTKLTRSYLGVSTICTELKIQPTPLVLNLNVTNVSRLKAYCINNNICVLTHDFAHVSHNIISTFNSIYLQRTL